MVDKYDPQRLEAIRLGGYPKELIPPVTPRSVVIIGSMCSGKTEELIRRAKRHTIAGHDVVGIKPSTDNRWGLTDVIRSRSGAEIAAITVPVNDPEDILRIVDIMDKRKEVPVVVLDEAQFFPKVEDGNLGIVQVVYDELIEQRGKEVLISGLPTNFRGEGFNNMPELLIRAQEMVQVYAICVVCGDERATQTQRLKPDGSPVPYDDPVIMVGDREYEARCLAHHKVPKDIYEAKK